MNRLNPHFMEKIFKSGSSCYFSKHTNGLKHIRLNQVTFGSNSGFQIWNCLQNKMRSIENLKSFIILLRQWNDPHVKCVVPEVVCNFSF